MRSSTVAADLAVSPDPRGRDPRLTGYRGPSLVSAAIPVPALLPRPPSLHVNQGGRWWEGGCTQTRVDILSTSTRPPTTTECPSPALSISSAWPAFSSAGAQPAPACRCPRHAPTPEWGSGGAQVAAAGRTRHRLRAAVSPAHATAQAVAGYAVAGYAGAGAHPGGPYCGGVSPATPRVAPVRCTRLAPLHSAGSAARPWPRRTHTQPQRMRSPQCQPDGAQPRLSPAGRAQQRRRTSSFVVPPCAAPSI